MLCAQRTGHIITISSIAGLIGQEFASAYAISKKFALEGWMESLHFDVQPYGIHTAIVEPGFFRTELLVDASTRWPELTIDYYAERTGAQKKWWQAQNGQQVGDPAKLARALLELAHGEQPPQRWVGGADAIDAATGKVAQLKQQVEAPRELGLTLALDDVEAATAGPSPRTPLTE
ncbi:SDR family NAD(P)-dependent oxidoreductase [Nocardia coffeae]|uniref:SDR family NAD(P)-dependent oxidoreductase n=1 Tax=Nocardia coffeae TaxID=2873381 RepID=UPI0027DF6FC2|nr:SDR family NAD(P)-dependent oxidoreductase [Nocardia coffeae]